MLILCKLSHFQLVYDLKVYSPKNFLFIHTTKYADDAHCIDAGYLSAKHKFEDANIWDEKSFD